MPTSTDRSETIRLVFASTADACGFDAESLMTGRHGSSACSAWRKAAVYVLVRVLHVPQQAVAATMDRAKVYEMVNEYRWSCDLSSDGVNHPSWRSTESTGRRARVAQIVELLVPDPCPTVTFETVVDE
jgi:hypothetical protein